MTALMILGLVVVGLWVFFAMLRFTFGLIERKHQRLREAEEAE
jgi:hypothetical protein